MERCCRYSSRLKNVFYSKWVLALQTQVFYTHFKILSMDNLKRPFYYDLSLWLLLFSNCATIYFAVAHNWPLITIMSVYWVQSCIIGFTNAVRIATLRKFSTEHFLLLGKPVQPTADTKRKTTYLFMTTYGFFHCVYGIILFFAAEVDLFPLLLGGTIFFVDHVFSFLYNREGDKKRTNLGELFFFPFARILPMHLVIVFYGVFLSGKGPLLLFLGLKTLADIFMHGLEHRL